MAYLFRSATGKIECLVPDAFALGMFEVATYQSRPLHLDRGDILVVYSDGFTDAQNQQKEMFGEERLLKIIRDSAPMGSRLLAESLLMAIAAFTHNTLQSDDITLMVIEKTDSGKALR